MLRTFTLVYASLLLALVSASGSTSAIAQNIRDAPLGCKGVCEKQYLFLANFSEHTLESYIRQILGEPSEIQSEGHDAPRLIDELVPRHTAVVDEIVVGFEDAIGEPIVPQELPDVFDRVELGAHFGGSGMMVLFAGTTRGRPRDDALGADARQPPPGFPLSL